MNSLIKLVDTFFTSDESAEQAAAEIDSIVSDLGCIPLILEYSNLIYNNDTPTHAKFNLAIHLLKRAIKRHQDSIPLEYIDMIRNFSLEYLLNIPDHKTFLTLAEITNYGIAYGPCPWEQLDFQISSLNFKILSAIFTQYVTKYKADPYTLFEEIRPRLEESIQSENLSIFLPIYSFLINSSIQVFKDPNIFIDYQQIVWEKLIYCAKKSYSEFDKIFKELVLLNKDLCCLIPPIEFFIAELQEIYSDPKNTPSFIRRCNKYLKMNEVDQDIIHDFIEFIVQILPENYHKLSPNFIKNILLKAGDEKTFEIINEQASDTSLDGIRLSLFMITAAVKVMPIHEEYAEYLLAVFEVDDIQIRIEAAQILDLFVLLPLMQDVSSQLTVLGSLQEIIDSGELEVAELDQASRSFTSFLASVAAVVGRVPDQVVVACAELLEVTSNTLILATADLGYVACFAVSASEEVREVQTAVLEALMGAEMDEVRAVALTVMHSFIDNGEPLPVFVENMPEYFELIDACLSEREFIDEALRGLSSIFCRLRDTDSVIVDAIIQRVPAIANAAIPQYELVKEDKLVSRLWNISLMLSYSGSEISPLVSTCIDLLNIVCNTKDDGNECLYHSAARIVNRLQPELVLPFFDSTLSRFALCLNTLNTSNNQLFKIVADVMVRAGEPLLEVETGVSKENFALLALQSIADVIRTEYKNIPLAYGPMYYLITLLEFDIPDEILKAIANTYAETQQFPSPEWSIFMMDLLWLQVFQFLDQDVAARAVEIAIESLTPDGVIMQGVIVVLNSALELEVPGVLESADAIRDIIEANFQAKLNTKQIYCAETDLGLMAVFYLHGAMGELFTRSVFQLVVTMNQFAAPHVYRAVLALMDSDKNFVLHCLKYFGCFLTTNPLVSIMECLDEALRRLVIFRDDNNGISAIGLPKENEETLLLILQNYENEAEE